MEGLTYGNIKRSLFGQTRDQGLLSSKQTRRSLHRGFLKTAQDGGPDGRLSGRAGGEGKLWEEGGAEEQTGSILSLNQMSHGWKTGSVLFPISGFSIPSKKTFPRGHPWVLFLRRCPAR